MRKVDLAIPFIVLGCGFIVLVDIFIKCNSQTHQNNSQTLFLRAHGDLDGSVKFKDRVETQMSVTAANSTLKSETKALEINSTLHALQKSAIMKSEQLLSREKQAISDVRGNLGPASVVTHESVEDWLKDRWQAALNMRGEPIPGVHWIVVDLEDSHYITKVIIDWEAAYSKNWRLYGLEKSTCANGEILCVEKSLGWVQFGGSASAITVQTAKLHIIQSIDVAVEVNEINGESFVLSTTGTKLAGIGPFRYVKLLILSPSTQWGSSIWRLQVWGKQ